MKKLIEVALPLEAINKASAREKQPGIGAHPRACISGGRGGHWRRRALSSLPRWWTTHRLRGRAAGGHEAAPQGAERTEGPSEAVGRGPDLRQEGQGSGLSVPEPGPVPTLDDMLGRSRARRGYSASSKTWCCGRAPTTSRCCSRHEMRSGRAGGEHAPKTRAIRGPKICSIGRSCQHSTTLRRRRSATVGGAAPGAGELRERFEPGGCTDQQGDDRNSAEVRWQAASKS